MNATKRERECVVRMKAKQNTNKKLKRKKNSIKINRFETQLLMIELSCGMKTNPLYIVCWSFLNKCYYK